jgi:MFS family permease
LSEALTELRKPRFVSALLSTAILSLFTLSDGLIFLNAQHKFDLAPGTIPLLFVFSAAGYVALSVPIGRLADNIGRARVFAAGYVCLALAYGLLLAPRFAAAPYWAELALLITLLALYYACTEGVIMARVSALIEPRARGTAIALLATCIGMGHLLASVLYGALWTRIGAAPALWLFVAGIAVALLAQALIARRESYRQEDHA